MSELTQMLIRHEGFRLLEEKVSVLQQQMGRLMSDVESEKGSRGRTANRAEEKSIVKDAALNDRFVKLEEGQVSIRLWIASATSIILFAMFLMELYFSTGRHVVP